MFGYGLKTRTTDQSRRVVEAKDRAAFRNLGHAAARIRKDAAGSVKKRKNKRKASPAGTPPFTHAGYAKQAIRFAADRFSAVVGFRRSKIGLVAATHEHGLAEEGRKYPTRPTIGPALKRNINRFARDWRATIGR